MAEPAIPDAPPESDAAGGNLSVDDIAFGARLVARELEQPSQPVVPTSQPAAGERFDLAGASSVKGSSSVVTQETVEHAGPSRSEPKTATTEEEGDPEPDTNSQAPPSQHVAQPAAEGSSIAHAGAANSPATGQHQPPVQEAGYAPWPARTPEAGGILPATRAPQSAADPGVRASGTAASDAPATGTARDIALRLNASDNSAVEVRLSERAGEVRVAVRSADPALTDSMRARLPELVDRLGARGFETEVWRPEQPAAERGGTGPNPDSHREPPAQQEPGNGRQKRDQPQPEWVEELAESLRQPNPVNRSTNQ